ncbi:MAG: hypothetical protein AABZ64_04920 [Nitrospinota bacterium]
MRIAMCGLLAGMVLLAASAAGAQEWVEYERRGATLREYRINARKPGGLVEADTRGQCLPGMRETKDCLLYLDLARLRVNAWPREDVPFHTRGGEENQTARGITHYVIDCAGRRRLYTGDEFFDAQGALLTRVRFRDPQWDAWGEYFILGPIVCR